MKDKVIWALAALNVLLVLGLLTPIVAPAQAQAARPSDYLLIPGEVIGGNSAIVWILDGKNQQLSAMTVDNRDRLEMMAPINLPRVFEAGGAAPGR